MPQLPEMLALVRTLPAADQERVHVCAAQLRAVVQAVDATEETPEPRINAYLA